MRVDISTEPDGAVSVSVDSKGYNPDTFDDILNRSLKVIQALRPRPEAPVKKESG